jgi:hypothetical protein
MIVFDRFIVFALRRTTAPRYNEISEISPSGPDLASDDIGYAAVTIRCSVGDDARSIVLDGYLDPVILQHVEMHWNAIGNECDIFAAIPRRPPWVLE